MLIYSPTTFYSKGAILKNTLKAVMYKNDNYMWVELQGALEALRNHNLSKSCLGKQQFSSHSQRTTIGRKKTRDRGSRSHTSHREGRSCRWHTAASTRLLSLLSIYKQGNALSLGCLSSMSVTVRSSAYQLMTLNTLQLVLFFIVKRALHNLLITEYK